MRVSLWGRRRVAAAVLGTLLIGACLPGYVRVSLTTTSATNGGTPLYLLVRTVEPKKHVAQPYSEVVTLLSAPDNSVVRTQLLFPGRSYRFYVKSPTKEALGLYFLFTAPGGAWSLLLPQPVPLQLQATLGSNIISEQIAR